MALNEVPAFIKADTTISGTFTDANISTIVITLDNGQGGLFNFNATIDAGAGTWSALISVAGMPDATYALTRTATDLAGNQTAESAGQLTLDTVAPIVAATAGQLPARINADRTFSGTFSELNIASITVSLDNGAGGIFTFAAVVDTAAGTWSAAVPIMGLPDGVYTPSVIATDAAGNSSTITASAGEELTVDTVADVTVNNVVSKFNTNTITGTVAADITSLQVTVNGQTYTSAGGDIVIVGTDWSLDLPSLAEGGYIIGVQATDSTGNTGSAEGRLVIDTTLPVAGLGEGQLPRLINGDATISGTFTDANIATIVISIDDGHGGTASFDAVVDAQAGTWNAQLLVAGLADGVYAVSVTGTDQAGNTATTTYVADQLTIDTTAPTVTFDVGQLPARTRTDTTLTGSFDGADTASVVIVLTGNGSTVEYPATLDMAARTWSVQLPVADLADGTYSVAAVITDTVGNSRTEDAPGTLVIDTTAEVTLTGGFSATSAATLTGTVGADVATLSITINDNTYTLASGDITVTGTNWTLSLPALPDGSYTMNISATDDLGNVKERQETLVVDTVAPVVAFDEGQLPATIKADKVLTGTFSDTNIATVVVTLDDGHGGLFTFNAVIDTTAGTWSAAVLVAGLNDGVYAVSVTATDTVGNATTVATADPLTLDTTAPVIGVAASPILSISGRPGLGGTVDDPTASIMVTIGNASAVAINNGDGTWSLPADTIAALPDGIYRVSVTATDTVGNARTFSDAIVIVNATAPAITVSRLVTTETSPAISGTVDDNGAKIMVTVNGVSYAAVNNGDGTWTLPAGTVQSLSQGVYDVSVTATDALGLASSDATTNELTVAGTQSITLGGGIWTVVYTDANGTQVTANIQKWRNNGPGRIQFTFTGVNVSVSGTGKQRTITADGGIQSVDIDVLIGVKGLSFATSDAAVSEINHITGGGLVYLTGQTMKLTGGISSRSVVKNVSLRNLLATDVQNLLA